MSFPFASFPFESFGFASFDFTSVLAFFDPFASSFAGGAVRLIVVAGPKKLSSRPCVAEAFDFFNFSIPLTTRSLLNPFSSTKNAISPASSGSPHFSYDSEGTF